MTRSDFIANLAGSSAALVQDYDLTGMLVRTIAEATEALDADAGGLLVTNRSGELELLSATSHAAVALETYQAFSGEGPCQECVDRQAGVGYTRAEVAERWPTVADLMATAGYEYVHSTPLRWRGDVLGGLNLFWAGPVRDLAVVVTEAQVYSDLLTLFIVNSDPVSPAQARERVELALEARTVIEQAKGVLAEQEDLEMAAAYLRLRQLESGSGRSLTEVARSVVAAAQQGLDPTVMRTLSP